MNRPLFKGLGAIALAVALVACAGTSSPWKEARRERAQPPASYGAGHELRATAEPQWIAVHRRGLPAGAMVTGPQNMIFDVRDLLAPRTSFPGPRIHLLASSAEAETFEPQQEESYVPDPDELVRIVQAFTGPEPWAGAHPGSIEVTSNGMLLVRADPATLAAIGGFLGM